MKTPVLPTLLTLFFSIFLHLLNAQECADSIFARYFRCAQHFADTYPREKVHLHFDNNSYYVKDSIWFKAYVTLAEGNLPSMISKPLYVELVDQLGNVIERQIVELQRGQGSGQMALKPSCLPGYYEVRAYTRWMLAFEEEECFSRTFPVYRQQQSGTEIQKSIGTYLLDQSMKQRPSEKESTLSLRFFPEGGSLVCGLPSVVAFEAESREEGAVSIAGVVQVGADSILTRFHTLHNGMGTFSYTPGAEPAVAVVEYAGKSYRFALPEALPEGYVMQVSNKSGALDIQVTRSSALLTDTLALFVSQQGRPLIYGQAQFADAHTLHSTVSTQQFAGGVTQVSLISTSGRILCERLCYVMPAPSLQIEALTPITAMYQPHAPIHYELMLKSPNASQVHLSVSVRDALRSDYSEFDNSLYTDLLLTSDLKGYIHQPGYYFVNRSPQRQRALDALLLVRGWRKYDLTQLMGARSFTPSHLPESQLVLHGQVRSSMRQRPKGNLLVSVFAKNDEQQVMGSTLCDSLGNFTIPVEAFVGTMDALIQTRKPNSKSNVETTVSLFRNFSPPLRPYDYKELHPQYQEMERLWSLSLQADSLLEDSLMRQSGFHLLDEVQVKAKKRLTSTVESFEQSFSAYYDVALLLDEMRDKGEKVDRLTTFLSEVNPNITINRQEKEGEMLDVARYNGADILYLINGVLVTDREANLFLENDVDAIKYIQLCKGKGALDRIYWPETSAQVGVASELASSSAFYCYITTIDSWKEDKKYSGSWGIRRTQLQGFSRPQEFYSPAYLDKKLIPAEGDNRRTLYWNPNLVADENGKVTIACYNAGSSTFPIVHVEAFGEDGRIASAVFLPEIR